MGFAENVAAVKGDVSGHAASIFIKYFEMFKEHQNVFDAYKGKDPNSLKSVTRFVPHVTAVVTLLIEILEKANDAAALKAACVKLAAMQQHKTLNIQQFKDLLPALDAHLSAALGGAYDKAGWTNAYNNFTTCLGGCM